MTFGLGHGGVQSLIAVAPCARFRACPEVPNILYFLCVLKSFK